MSRFHIPAATRPSAEPGSWKRHATRSPGDLRRWISAAVILTLSCGDAGAEPEPSPPSPVAAAVTVTPASVTLTAIGATIQLAAEVRDQNGQVMAGAAVTWSSSDPSVASMDASGLVTAVSDGSTTVTASSGPASGDVGVVVQSGSASSDREALQALYHAAGGSSWTRGDNWLTDAPLREWFGVEVDDANRVRRLLLADNGLKGSIPPELGNLGALQTLALRKNVLSGSIPSELGRLGALRFLDLGNNSLSGPIPKELGGLANLVGGPAPFSRWSGRPLPEASRCAKMVLKRLRP